MTADQIKEPEPASRAWDNAGAGRPSPNRLWFIIGAAIVAWLVAACIGYGMWGAFHMVLR